MQRFKDQFHAMGTLCEVEIFARDVTHAGVAFAQVRQDVKRLESRYSRYLETSELSAINHVAAQGGAIEVDDETASLLNYAQACFDQSGGLFDVTSGILRRAWNFHIGCLPEQAAIDQLLVHVGWNKLSWRAPYLRFASAGQEIDLGGIVKEYAADRAGSLCRAVDIRHGYVNLGGDLTVIGPQPDGSPWQIGIRHPRNPNMLMTTLALASGAVASSGDYERCIVVGGVRYGHILNPRTGWPVRAIAAVTVQAPMCVVAGSLATIAMLKEHDGPLWLAEIDLPCIWMSINGEVGGWSMPDHKAP